jgi:hypothetical protein
MIKYKLKVLAEELHTQGLIFDDVISLCEYVSWKNDLELTTEEAYIVFDLLNNFDTKGES